MKSELPLQWAHVFVLPVWLRTWWAEFAGSADLHLRSVRHRDELIGISPLLLLKKTAAFIGDTDVCDYQDFIVVPGKEREYFNVLLDHLNRQGATQMDLRLVRPDSKVMTELVPVAESLGCKVSCEKLDVAFELELPATWDDYLLMLNGKQRHEVRRKFRRLEEAARFNFHVFKDIHQTPGKIETFFTLFALNREDKAAFMTDRMVSFFHSLAEVMAETGILRMYLLELDDEPAAAVMGFDYRDTTYLYNNGYNGRFSSLSVGLLSKVLSKLVFEFFCELLLGIFLA
jgi:CelD/BcsL family acetyltransferase involved in cellulose biosynthesis